MRKLGLIFVAVFFCLCADIAHARSYTKVSSDSITLSQAGDTKAKFFDEDVHRIHLAVVGAKVHIDFDTDPVTQKDYILLPDKNKVFSDIMIDSIKFRADDRNAKRVTIYLLTEKH